MSKKTKSSHNGRPATPDCVDLQKRFGRRYRIGYDECH